MCEVYGICVRCAMCALTVYGDAMYVRGTLYNVCGLL